jgi:hypothetical protein
LVVVVVVGAAVVVDASVVVGSSAAASATLACSVARSSDAVRWPSASLGARRRDHGHAQ